MEEGTENKNEETATPEAEEKITPRPIFIEDAIPYQIDWEAIVNEKFAEGYSLSWQCRYTINPEVMMVVSEIVRHQLQEVMDMNKDLPKKQRMTPGQLESHGKTIRLMEKNINGLARKVYERQLAKQERQRAEHDGTLPKIEIVSDLKVIKEVTKSREDKK